MGQDSKDNEGNLRDEIESLIGDANKVIKVAVVKGSQAAESVGESLKDAIKDTLDGARSARDSVVMVRMNKESLARVDELVEADIAGSRSEAAAFLIAEGIKAKQGLFDTMAEKLEQIRKTREELKRLLEDEREQTPETSEES
ncbi:MAG: hypothetical protein O3A47_01515 [Chloroflexi bacterium]|nr:hypothetical protein [Chloroflexota bacterium]